MTSITPLMRQYLEIKSNHKGRILMFRLGDFYEMFYEDAKVASFILNIALTSRNKKSENQVPMCGVPYHSVSSYISKLLAHGHSVVLCDQVEDPKEAKGIVKRAVTRILSPGMVYDPETLNSLKAHYLCSFDQKCIAFLDVSTGEAFYYTFLGFHEREDLSLFSFIFLLSPVEIVLREDQKRELEQSGEGKKVLKDFHITVFNEDEWKGGNSWNERGEEGREKGISLGWVEKISTSLVQGEGDQKGGVPFEDAIQFLKAYVQSTQGKSFLKNLNSFENRTFQNRMMLSNTLCQHLEIFQSHHQREEKGSFCHHISRVKTSQGARLLKSWISFPLISRDLIQERQSEVEFWFQRPERLKALRKEFSGFSDLERGIGKLAHPNLNARDLITIKESLVKGIMLSDLACKMSMDETLSPLTFKFLKTLDGTSSLAVVERIIEKIESTLLETPSVNVKQGGMIKKGVSNELDQWISAAEDTKKKLFEMEVRERKETGISSLKIRYNQVFGYYIEITNMHKDKVPASYIRRQTLAQAERYVTSELKSLEVQILHAKEKREKLEFQIFEELRLQVLKQVLELKTFSNYVSQLDVLSSFAWLALELNYVRPSFSLKESSFLELEESRHPVLEQELKFKFVSNSLKFKSGDCLILTGPNMAGKSTIMRQVALISILAQMGSFVPAKKAILPIFNRIFTRIGASDNLLEGLSTFMLEMKETVEILERSDSNSLVILDEVGRGTSTYDGLSLAQALLEFLVLKKKPYILFATHYHELTRLSQALPQVFNFHMKIAEKKSSSFRAHLKDPSEKASHLLEKKLEGKQKQQLEPHGLEVSDGEEDIEFLYRLSPGRAEKSYGIFVAQLAGFPPSVIKRAREILKFFESEKSFDFKKISFSKTPFFSKTSSPRMLNQEFFDEKK